MPDPVEYNIDDVVALDPADTTAFTPEHKAFLEEHKDELTTDELTKFGFEVTAPKPPEIKKDETPAPAPAAATATGESDEEKENARITGIVKKELDPIKAENQRLQAKVDIDGFIVANPSFAKYRQSITEYKNHPNYANVPVHELAKMVAADDLVKIGARAERAAAAKANGTRQPGNSARNQGNQKDWGSAAKDDFAAKRAEVLGRR